MKSTATSPALGSEENLARQQMRRKAARYARVMSPFIYLEADGCMLSNIGHPRPEDVAAYL